MSFEDKRLDRLAGDTNLSNASLSKYEWLAFQYLCDELTIQQRSDFEEALSTDPAAAEAISAMVAMTLQVQAAAGSRDDWSAMNSKVSVTSPARSHESSVSQTTGRKTGLLWLAGLAAGLLLLVGASQFFGPSGSNPKLTVIAEAPTESEMAEVWSGNFEDEFTNAFDRLDENSNFDAPDSKTPATSSSDAQTENEATEDDWLYAVLVSLESTEDWPSEGQGGS
jgi:hypothetical protein